MIIFLLIVSTILMISGWVLAAFEHITYKQNLYAQCGALVCSLIALAVSL